MATATPAALNPTQRLFRQWRGLHPYNAAQAMRLARAEGDPAGALAEAVGPLGVEVGFAEVDDLEAHLSAELNAPFTDDVPLRGFVCGDWLGVAYDHWLADSVAVRLLMRRWAALLTGHEPPALELGPAAGRPPWPTPGAMVEAIRSQRQARRMRRLPRLGDASAAHLRHDVPAGLCAALLARCRADGVKLHDAFVAAAARTVNHALGPGSRRRPDVGVGTVVDDRAALPPGQRGAFGVHLAFRSAHLAEADLADMPAAVRAAAAASAASRRPATRAAVGLLTRASLVMGRFADARSLAELYRKRVPLIAGISNVNLDAGPVGALHPGTVRAYHRVSPLGPAMAAVFAPTTLGGELSLGVTHRTALLDVAKARACAERFVADLAGYAGGVGG